MEDDIRKCEVYYTQVSSQPLISSLPTPVPPPHLSMHSALCCSQRPHRTSPLAVVPLYHSCFQPSVALTERPRNPLIHRQHGGGIQGRGVAQFLATWEKGRAVED